MTFNTCYKDTGLFGVYTTCHPQSAQAAAWTVCESMVRLCHKTTEGEVNRAKQQLKASLLAQLDGTSAVAEDIGRQVLTYNRRVTPHEAFSRVDLVTAEEVKRVANKYINDAEIAVSAFGSIHELPDLGWLRRHMYHQRH